ncbi:MAG TPA: shikimate dehydrogenase [Candidatus Baltobacteraceae bacterium]
MKLAVIGDPVAHSRSPEIHTTFLREAGIVGTYEAIRVPAGTVKETVERLRAQGYVGLNVTTPLKEEAYRICDTRDDVAAHSGSVNTMTLRPGGIAGANTDGVGAISAVESATGTSVEKKSVLVLGVGPTARSAAYALRSHGADVFIWNRTAERAVELAQRFDLKLWRPGVQIDVTLSTLPPQADLDEALVAAMRKAPVVIDANYGKRATLAHVLGRPTVDGEQWLLAQARASFAIWRRE